MSTEETFAYGMVGGAIGYVAVFVLPELRRWFENGIVLTFARVGVALAILAVYLLMPSVVAIMIGDAERPKHAIAYGVGWEAFIKAAAFTVEAAAARTR